MPKYTTGEVINYTYTSWPPMSQPEINKTDAVFIKYKNSSHALINIKGIVKTVTFSSISKKECGA